LFHKYNGLTNIKWFAAPFNEGEHVVVQEKLHGTNARASVLPYRANTLWRKLKKFLGLAPLIEKCYGSNNVDISSKKNYTGFYGEDVYGSTFSKMDVFSKLKLGETVYGEIIGPSIQANYTYGLKEHRFVIFDVKILKEDGSQEWLNPHQVEEFARERGFEIVPKLYAGEYNKELIYGMTRGPSVYCPSQKVREGVVVKAAADYCVQGNKRAYKWISEDYLDDKSNTDNH
jgi:RNA ligase (TIGR02306 family)